MQWTPNSGYEFALIFSSARTGRKPRMLYVNILQAYRKKGWTGDHTKDKYNNLDYQVSISYDYGRINRDEATKQLTTQTNHGHNLESNNLDNKTPM